MKTFARLLAVIITLDSSLRALPGSTHPADALPRGHDLTIGPIMPHDRVEHQFPATEPGKLTPTPEVMDLARRARDQFELGNFEAAENIYDEALEMAPDNLYLLSNKAVCQFRRQHYQLAEETFKKAIDVAPEDDFSHCTLGIVLYQQGKLDEAIRELTKAISVNSKNATAHNYFGICASQKGWTKVAQKELESAVTIDPAYADAHFNFAVVLASQNPPAKKAARKHYRRAIKLGAEPDASLEQMIK